jgi:hypothetical protein
MQNHTIKSIKRQCELLMDQIVDKPSKAKMIKKLENVCEVDFNYLA